MKTPPERWSTRAPTGDARAAHDSEARAGVLLRRSVLRQPLSAGALADVRSRLPDGRLAPTRRLALSFSVALALFLSGGAVVMSATLLGRWSPFRRTGVAPATTTPAPELRRARHASTTATSPALQAFAEPTPSVAVLPPDPPRRSRAPRPPETLDTPVPDAIPPAAAPAASSAIAEEAALLGAALRRLREQADAAGALALLDEHDRRFATTGALADEASTTRVEALLRLGEHGRALALLDARSPRPTGRGRELLASRGELRADADRCPEALSDFELLLADDAAADDAAERALYGRAACRARTGDADAARADLRAYLARFPDGRFASRARGALAR